MDETVEETLQERGAVYGSYDKNLRARAAVMAILNNVYRNKEGLDLDIVAFQALNDIVIKLVRLAATPEHIDSWNDCAGYAELNKKRITDDHTDK